MTTTPYIGRLNPEVGGGLGGLPRRADVAGAGAAQGLIVKNRAVLSPSGTGDLAIPFPIEDVRRVAISIKARTVNAGSSWDKVPPNCTNFFIGEFAKAVFINYGGANNNLRMVFTIKDADNLNFTELSNPTLIDIVVIEYDLTVLSSENVQGVSTVLSNEVLDPAKTIMSLIPNNTASSATNLNTASSVVPFEFSSTYMHLMNITTVTTAEDAMCVRLNSSTSLTWSNATSSVDDSFCNILQVAERLA